MKEFFTTILYKPMFNALAWLYQNVAFQDLGVAIILLTLVIRFLLFPLFQKTVKHQQITQNIQPEIKKIQKKHKDDKEAQAKDIIELYGKHKINPMTPLIALAIQLPIIFVLYRIFINGFSNGALDLLYSSIHLPAAPEQTFLGLIDLTQSSLVIAVLAAVLQYTQGSLSLKKRGGNKGDEPSKAEKMGKKMILFMPVITLAILSNLPAAVGIYWSTTTIFSIFQQALVVRSLNKEDQKKLSLGHDGTS